MVKMLPAIIIFTNISFFGDTEYFPLTKHIRINVIIIQ